VAHEVDEVGRVAAVEHAEALREPQAPAMPADEAIGDRVEGARPGQAHLLLHLAEDALRAARHFERRASREGEEQDPLGRRALQDEMRHPVRERIRLAGARAREDEQRLAPGKRGFALPGIEAIESGRGAHGRHYRLGLYKLPVPGIDHGEPRRGSIFGSGKVRIERRGRGQSLVLHRV
jgi:hypothetical protein